MPEHLWLSISLPNHKSGIVAASLSRHPDTPNHPILRMQPIHAEAHSLGNIPTKTPVKQALRGGRVVEVVTASSKMKRAAPGGIEVLPAKRVRFGEDDGILERYAAGGLLLDKYALANPSRYTVAQIKWAEGMVTSLLEGVDKRYDALNSRLIEIAGDQYGWIVLPVYSAEQVDLADSHLVPTIAHAGTIVEREHINFSPPATVNDCQELDRLLSLLRTWMGRCGMLEKIVHEQEQAV